MVLAKRINELVEKLNKILQKHSPIELRISWQGWLALKISSIEYNELREVKQIMEEHGYCLDGITTCKDSILLVFEPMC